MGSSLGRQKRRKGNFKRREAFEMLKRMDRKSASGGRLLVEQADITNDGPLYTGIGRIVED